MLRKTNKKCTNTLNKKNSLSSACSAPAQPPPTSCEYRFTTVPQTTRNLLKFQGMSPGLPEAALSHAKSGEDWSPFTSTCDAMRCDAMRFERPSPSAC